MNPLCPLSSDDCVKLTKIVFDTFARREQTKPVLSLYLLVNPDVKHIPEEVRVEPSIFIEAQSTLLTNFISFDGLYSPPLLINKATHLSYELLPANLGKGSPYQG
jgi:hypothetical protein